MIETLRPILARFTPHPAPIGRDTELAGLGIDSFALIDLAVAVEDAFGVRVPDEAVARFQTVGDLADFLTASRRPGAAAVA